MATAFTHALVGASLAPLDRSGVSRLRLAMLLAALAVLPDLDVIGFRLGMPYAHPLGHRGLSHSLVFAVLLAPLAARLVFPRLRPFSRPWLSVVVLLAIATASHGVLDALTDAGLGVGFFVPFADSRHFLPWRPLATSPLSVSAFLSERGLAILANEVLWVWLPLGAVLGLVFVSRRAPASSDLVSGRWRRTKAGRCPSRPQPHRRPPW